MLTIYRDPHGSIRSDDARTLPPEVIWIDLLNPTNEEKAFVEKRTHIRVPSLDALSEIESSSRLLVDSGILYLSTPLVAQGETDDAFLSPAGFILAEGLLVTVRFAALPTFDAVADQVRHDEALRSGSAIFTALLEALVDRGADVLERLGARLDQISRSVFRGDRTRLEHTIRSNTALRRTLSAVGAIGDRLSQARDVLLGIGRIPPYVLSIRNDSIVPEFEDRLAAISRDIASLNDYEGHLSNKVQFLLDAILGFISIAQNDIFKVLTIVSVVGIPPTLVAGIYGMNFKFMPELGWDWGYGYGLAMIVLSGVIPLLWFKWRGWF
jgi:magnesium transporter